jgi:hypothetical protein
VHWKICFHPSPLRLLSSSSAATVPLEKEIHLSLLLFAPFVERQTLAPLHQWWLWPCRTHTGRETVHCPRSFVASAESFGMAWLRSTMCGFEAKVGFSPWGSLVLPKKKATKNGEETQSFEKQVQRLQAWHQSTNVSNTNYKNKCNKKLCYDEKVMVCYVTSIRKIAKAGVWSVGRVDKILECKGQAIAMTKGQLSSKQVDKVRQTFYQESELGLMYRKLKSSLLGSCNWNQSPGMVRQCHQLSYCDQGTVQPSHWYNGTLYPESAMSISKTPGHSPMDCVLWEVAPRLLGTIMPTSSGMYCGNPE